jgi:hypothetical protein
MSRHILKILATAVTVTLLMICTTVPVLAFDVRSGDDVTVPHGEAVDGPLYVGATDTITIDGTVNGGVRAAARTINVNGMVNGSVMAVGQTININGHVSGDVTVGCATLNIASTAKIGGILRFAAGLAQIEGAITGSGTAVGVGHQVNGNGALEVRSLTILPAPPPAAGDQAARFNPFSLFSGALGKLTGFLMALIAGLIIILIAPRRLTSVAASIRARPGLSAGWGAIILIVTPIAVIIACLTIVGLSAGLITLAFYGIAIYLAQIPVSLLIGMLIIGRFRAVEGKAIMIGALASGLAIITLLKLIPYFGFFVSLAVIIFGLGALLVTEKQRRAKAVT